MAIDPELESKVRAYNQICSDPGTLQALEQSEQAPRFELYHYSNSIFSQHVRAVLFARNSAFVSHQMDVHPGCEHYKPEYMRMRIHNWKKQEGSLVSAYSGQTSTETEGFDPFAVPTLIDHDAGRSVVDSKQICLYIDAVLPGEKLIPEPIAQDVLQHVSANDRFPHPALLYGPNPEREDSRPPFIIEATKKIHDLKFAKLQEQMQGLSDSFEKAAYESKIRKEEGGRLYTRSPEQMRETMQQARDYLQLLDQSLARSQGDYLFGDSLTMADLLWGCTLFRLKWLGLDYLWMDDDGKAMPLIEAYARRLFEEPCISQACIHYPDAPPTPYVQEYYS